MESQELSDSKRPRSTDLRSSYISSTSLQLPHISRLDTGSLVNLFQRFSSTEFATSTDLAVVAKDFAWPALASTPSMSVADGSIDSSRAAPNRKVVPVRNDSTGSSSIASSGRSLSTPSITRHSSCSSVDEKSPTPPPKDDKHSQVTALPKIDTLVTVTTSPEPIKRPSRTSTLDSIISHGSSTLHTDKPLPAQPKTDTDNALKSTRSSRNAAPSELDSCLPVRSRTELPPLMHRRSATMTFTSSSSEHATSMSDLRPRLRGRSHSATTVAELPASLPSIAPRPLAPRKTKAYTSANRFQITARTAEGVIYRIMSQLERPEDLMSAALVSKGFLNTFQRNESKLVSRLVFRSSRAAWETRRSIIVLRASRAFTLCDYQRDIRTLKALKTFILAHCSSQCRPRTLAGLAAKDKIAETDVDDALWRVWTFCALFGENAAQGSVSPSQIDWLNGSNATNGKAMGAGFAVGNGNGLSAQQMEAMVEMWQCLRTLMSRFHGRYAEALQAGVLDEWNPSNGMPEDVCISEWTSYLMTLGPQTILALSSASFDKARFLGLAKWTLPPPGASRSTFLTAAISELYQRRLLNEATAHAEQISLPKQSCHRPSRSVDETRAADTIRKHALRIDTQSAIRRPLSMYNPSYPRPEIRPDCDAGKASDGHRRQVSNPIFPASPTSDPTFYQALSMNRAVSTRLGATLFPVDYPPTRPKVPFIAERAQRFTPPASQVIDPTDKALHLLVKEMGFTEANAKRALAMTDSGSGINVQRAIELLSIDHAPRAINSVPIELPTPIDIVAPLRSVRSAIDEDRCDGSCRNNPPPPVQYRSSVVRRSNTRSRSLSLSQPHPSSHTHTESNTSSEVPTPISPVTDIYGGHSARSNSVSSLEWRREAVSGDTMSPLVHSAKPSGSNSNSLGRAQSKAWRILGVANQQQQHRESTAEADSPLAGAVGLGIVNRTRSKTKTPKSNVVAMDEYLERIERRRSQRVVQEGWKAHAQFQAQARTGALSAGPVDGDEHNTVFVTPTSATGATTQPSTPGALVGGSGARPMVYSGNTGGLGGFRPVVAAVTADSYKKSSPDSKARKINNLHAVAPNDAREAEAGASGGGGGGGGKMWRSVVGTVKGGMVGHYKNSKRERQVAKEMCVGGGEKAFVG